jgi:hypothetical protein
MLAAGMKSPVPLEELESHLRDEIDRQIKLGEDGQRAFENATGKIGRPGELKEEFKKGAIMRGRKESLFELICAAATFFLSLYGGFFVLYWSVSDLQSPPTESYRAGAICCFLMGLAIITGCGTGALMCLTKMRLPRNVPAK